MSDCDGMPEMMDVPAEVAQLVEECCGQMFTTMAAAGNDKTILLTTLETLLHELQGVLVRNANLISHRDSNAANISMLMLTLLVRVAFGNPIYGSEALTLQLRNELSNILGEAKGFRIDP